MSEHSLSLFHTDFRDRLPATWTRGDACVHAAHAVVAFARCTDSGADRDRRVARDPVACELGRRGSGVEESERGDASL